MCRRSATGTGLCDKKNIIKVRLLFFVVRLKRYPLNEIANSFAPVSVGGESVGR